MNFSGLVEELRDFDINDLDYTNAGAWPIAIKAIVWAIILGLVVFLGYYLHLNELQERLDWAVTKEAALKNDYAAKSFKAANLDAYILQMNEMEKSFGSLLKQLPSDTEVPGLLEDITHTGLGAGLEIKSITLQNERPAAFYIELPIDIKVEGRYHDFASFVSGVASLPRIVTLHDFSVVPSTDANDDGLLTMTIQAKTYRYGDEDK